MWGTGTDMEVMRRLALEEPPLLEAAMPDAPPALVALHARLVAHDPADRPATAKEVADELRAYAAAWPAPDTTAVRAMMQRLFEDQAQARRERLNESLVQAAPTRVESLRKTLALSSAEVWTGSSGPGNTANKLTPRNCSSGMLDRSNIPGSTRLATQKMLRPSLCLR